MAEPNPLEKLIRIYRGTAIVGAALIPIGFATLFVRSWPLFVPAEICFIGVFLLVTGLRSYRRGKEKLAEVQDRTRGGNP